MVIDEVEFDWAVHGGNDNQCVNEDRRPELDFECYDCGRKICWCFGSGCERDYQSEEGKGVCCDCCLDGCN